MSQSSELYERIISSSRVRLFGTVSSCLTELDVLDNALVVGVDVQSAIVSKC